MVKDRMHLKLFQAIQIGIGFGGRFYCFDWTELLLMYWIFLTYVAEDLRKTAST